MNARLQAFARTTLKEGLAKLPADWQHRFKQMYAHNHLEWEMDMVVDRMNEADLDWAMTQVENSLKKLEKAA
jgi:fructosamine-3-kinase